MDEQARLRQFYLRSLLSLGVVWGCLLFITAPFIFRGNNDTTLEISAVVFNSLTLMPACIVALWHRRTACIWLTINAVGIVMAAASSINRLHNIGVAIGVIVPIIIAVALDFMELMRWPKALSSS